MDFQKSKSKENLVRAFAGECMDGAKYQFIIKGCKQEYKYLSDLLKTIAKNEMAHAGIFYKLIVKYGKNDVTNVDIKAGYSFEPLELMTSLVGSLEVERKESQKIYPLFAKTAREEGFPDIAEAFETVAADEEHHVVMLSQICERLKNKQLYKCEHETFWLCSNCAHHEMAREAWKQCPSCGFPQGFVQFTLEQKLPASVLKRPATNPTKNATNKKTSTSSSQKKTAKTTSKKSNKK